RVFGVPEEEVTKEMRRRAKVINFGIIYGMFGNMFGPKDKGMEMGRCMCPMHKMMVRRIMDREIIATYDGGIAVVLGNKITKYDKDMNLIKEVEIKIDMEVMKKSMEEMKKNCPMCSKMQDKK
ncbi:MAG: DNA polymerase, partial [Candidatus Omnitrophica bacterium]|nr:DNA polymerase [Candidatus Omnitrophota bacterium]